MDSVKLAGSFRDPNGFLFFRNGLLYRQVNIGCRQDYDLLMSSGLYEHLVGDGMLVGHDEVDTSLALTGEAYRVIRPEIIPFISYPYEWCFSQLKDAALLTLGVQRKALEFGMSLKDASAYNVQFSGVSPVFIDTLSFERYHEGEPWAAYRQFCQHFLAPLALMRYVDIRLSQLLRIHVDGVPLDLASSLLPRRTKLILPLLTHLHVHAHFQRRYAGSMKAPAKGRVSLGSVLGLIDSLEGALRRLRYRPEGTEWADYYNDTSYSREGMSRKESLVARYVDLLNPRIVWDFGANTGRFSRIAAARGSFTVSFDVDPAAVELNYLECSRGDVSKVLPLLLDLTNPSPGTGWACAERMSIEQRGPADTLLALAIIHHLALSNNLPFEEIARFFARLCSSLVIEFIPKTDAQVRRLLVSREDIFDRYRRDDFERAFGAYFAIEQSEPITGTERTLYLMRRR
jgi:hypothetical protein